MTEDKIIGIVCKKAGVPRSYLSRKTKNRRITTAKHLIAHYLWRELRYPIRKISGVVSLRPQSLYGVVFPEKVRARRSMDPDFNELYQMIEAEISPKNSPL